MKNPGNRKIILASASPRRQQLLRGLDIDFEVRISPTDEQFPSHLRQGEIAEFLANQKADAAIQTSGSEEIIITADTIVWIGDQVLNKPAEENEALKMLRMLSGNTHTVYTGVCLASREKRISFVDATAVRFATLTDEECQYYIHHYAPFDKAGAYGAQDWIGLVGIERLEGSYFNVMGLPVHRVYRELVNW